MATRRKKAAHEEEHENHERWLITYADMITLLMVLFIVLYSIGQVDLAKFEKLRLGLPNSGGKPISGPGPLDGGPSVLGGPSLIRETPLTHDAAAVVVDVAEPSTATPPNEAGHGVVHEDETVGPGAVDCNIVNLLHVDLPVASPVPDAAARQAHP